MIETAEVPAKAQKVYTRQFWLLCASSMLFYSSFSMIIPELPAYLQQMGGGDYKGWIVGLFAIMAAISRPFSGKLADSVGRVPVILFGAFVCVACSLCYPLVGVGIAGFFAIRMAHGMSTGFTPTGLSSYVADIAPQHRRGEAIGVQTLIANLGMASGQSLGSTLTSAFSIDVMFYASSASALISVLMLMGLKETVKAPQPFSLSLLRLKRKDLFEPRVFFVCIIMMISLYCFGLVLTVAPDFSESLGVANKGLFFSFVTLSSIITRALGGKASDRWGRPVVVLVAISSLSLTMAYLSFVETPLELYIGGFLFGLSHGMVGPTLFAWAIDKAKDGALGRALSSVYIALEVGVLLGAIVGGWIYGNNLANIPLAFQFASGFTFVGVLLVLGYQVKKRGTGKLNG